MPNNRIASGPHLQDSRSPLRVRSARGGDAVPVSEPEQVLVYCGLGVAMRNSSD